MQEITYDCANCYTHYVVWDKSMPPISLERHNDLSELVRKQVDEVGSCKFCVRKDPNIPTTAEMDGLLTVEDMRNRDQVVRQCRNCKAWTQMKLGEELIPCTGIVKNARIPKYDGCGQTSYDSSSMKSLRTFNPTTDVKRKPNLAKK